MGRPSLARNGHGQAPLRVPSAPDLTSVMRRFVGRPRLGGGARLPDFFLSYEHDTVHVLVATGTLELVRWELAVFLSDDGTIESTEWVGRPEVDPAAKSLALAGLMNIHASLARPVARVADQKVPLWTTLEDGITVEEALSRVIAVTRGWTNLFGEGAENASLYVEEFRHDVARLQGCTQHIDLVLRGEPRPAGPTLRQRLYFTRPRTKGRTAPPAATTPAAHS